MFEYLLPDEHRLDEMLKKLAGRLTASCQAWDTEHFLTDRREFNTFLADKKLFLMESFYHSEKRRTLKRAQNYRDNLAGL